MTHPTHPQTARLVLQFNCRHCRQGMSLAVTRCISNSVRCIHCAEATRLPDLDYDVEGFAEVANAVTRQGEFACPACQRQITLTLEELEQLHRCPECDAQLQFQLSKADDRDNSPPGIPPVESRRPTRPESTRESDDQSATSRSWDKAEQNDEEEEQTPRLRQRRTPPPEPLPRQRRTSRTPQEDSIRSHHRSDGDDQAKDQTNYYDDDTGHNRRPRRGGSGIPIWVVYKLVVWGAVLTPLWLLILALILDKPALFGWAVAMFFLGYPVYWVMGVLIPEVMALFIRRIHCPGCGESHDAVNVWNCSCGYHDHKRRHVLLFRCPLCKSCIGRTNCDRCGCTIRIRQ